MKTIWLLIGNIIYFFTRPLIALLLRNSKRTRVMVVHKDNILLVKGWLGDGSWMLPGGGLHKHETPVAGVLREVREETGLTLKAMTLTDKGTFKCQDRGYNFHYQLFITRIMESVQPTRSRIEIGDVAWVARHDIEQYKVTAEVTQALLFWPK